MVVLDALELIGQERYVHVTTAQHVLQRIKETLDIPIDIPLVILISKADEIQMEEPEALREISEFAAGLGFAPKVILCASFSRIPEVVPNGTGVIDAIEHIIGAKSGQPLIDWKKLRSRGGDSTQRGFHQFGLLR